MRKTFYPFLAIAIWLAANPAAHAGWPARVFAPYMYVGSGDDFQLTRCDDMTGQKFFTLAFVIAGRSNNPEWDGRIPMADDFYAGQIAAIRKRGGDVIVSFGGEAGRELALVETNAVALQAKYQSVIDRYHFTWLDFDIEGGALLDTAANQRRNTALAWLQAKNPGLIISYTLPVDPDGIPDEAKKLLSDAKAKGLKVHSANVMTMDFAPQFSRGKKMSDVAIASAIRARGQCQKIDPALQIGITPMIGRNDQRTEIFTEADARALENWAAAKKWVCSLSFWSVNRDSGNKPGKRDDNTNSGIIQKPWAFTGIFQTFATR
jgi:hypothetical protein